MLAVLKVSTSFRLTVRSLIFTSEKGIKSCRVMVLANKERKAFSWRKESVFEAD